jgi:hypothetical protein
VDACWRSGEHNTKFIDYILIYIYIIIDIIRTCIIVYDPIHIGLNLFIILEVVQVAIARNNAWEAILQHYMHGLSDRHD